MDAQSDPSKPLPSRLVQTPWLLLAVTVTVWGANVVVARASATEVSAFALVTLRWLVVCLLIAAYERGRVVIALRQLRPHWLYVIPMGAAGFTGSNGMLFAGAKYTTGLNIAIVTAVIPVLVILGVRLVYGSRIGGRRMIGVVMTIVGILIVATQGDLTAIGALRFNFGDLIEFGGALFYAGYTVALRRKPPIPAMAFFIGIALSAFAVSLPALAVEVATGAIIWPGYGGWAAIFYVAVFTSIIGQLSWIKAIERIGPSRAGVFQNLVPIIGASLSVLVLGETFHWYHALSLALVLAGIFISERMGK
jgi:drug/metabolite transporter (DMT)-like permease